MAVITQVGMLVVIKEDKMEFYIGKEFNLDQYDDAYAWLEEQENPYYTFEEIDPVGEERMFKLVDTTPTEEELAQAEAERIAKLYLTGADVERGIYQAKGMDFDDILAFVMVNPPEGLDVKALKIELKANHFYRGNPYVDAIGGLLGFTKEQLDKFFESGDYEHLLTTEESASLPTSPTGEETLEDVAPLQTSLADEILSDESEEFEKEID